MPELLAPDDVEMERQDGEQISALAILNQSEHAAMVETANRSNNRRKLADFESKLRAYANHSQPIALSMFYSLPRAGKQIIGPSVRFSEIVAPCWRNCRTASRPMGDATNTVTAQGIFIDYEANLLNSVEIPRRITDKDGKRYGDDMIVTTLNAALSVAKRNAVLNGGVPRALWTTAYEEAQQTAVGRASSHAQRVADAMEYLLKLGITEWQVLNSVGVANTRELEVEHLVTLRVLCAEVKRGDKTIEQVFGSPYDKEIESLFAQLKMNDAQQRMLRSSYMGRAKELCEYLQERLGTPRTPTPQPAQPIVQESVPEGTQSVEDFVAQKSTPVFNEKQEQQTESVATPKRGRPSKTQTEQPRRTAVSPEVMPEVPAEVAEQAQQEMEEALGRDDLFAF